MEEAKKLLRSLGIRSTYSGYNYLATAIVLTLENQDYLRNVMKKMYTVIGKKYGVSNHCVESALRTLIMNYWNVDEGKMLNKMLDYPLRDRPTPREFISILSDYLRDH